jgi:chaperonin cofactor prefoldin
MVQVSTNRRIFLLGRFLDPGIVELWSCSQDEIKELEKHQDISKQAGDFQFICRYGDKIDRSLALDQLKKELEKQEQTIKTLQDQLDLAKLRRDEAQEAFNALNGKLEPKDKSIDPVKELTKGLKK